MKSCTNRNFIQKFRTARMIVLIPFEIKHSVQKSSTAFLVVRITSLIQQEKNKSKKKKKKNRIFLATFRHKQQNHLHPSNKHRDPQAAKPHYCYSPKNNSSHDPDHASQNSLSHHNSQREKKHPWEEDSKIALKKPKPCVPFPAPPEAARPLSRAVFSRPMRLRDGAGGHCGRARGSESSTWLACSGTKWRFVGVGCRGRETAGACAPARASCSSRSLLLGASLGLL